MCFNVARRPYHSSSHESPDKRHHRLAPGTLADEAKLKAFKDEQEQARIAAQEAQDVQEAAIHVD